MNYLARYAAAIVVATTVFSNTVNAQGIQIDLSSDAAATKNQTYGRDEAGVALKPKTPTLTIKCTCDCGGTYSVVETLGASSCKDLTKSGRSCVKDGEKHPLKDCGLRPTAKISLPFDGNTPVVSNGGGTVPGVLFASTTVNCPSGKNFVINTGNSSGSCTVKETDGQVSGGTCTDGANESSASCSKNSGKGACGNTQGSGGCAVSK